MSVTSIELQVISRILTSKDSKDVDTLCAYDLSYFSIFKQHMEFILNHRQRYGEVPDVFTFQSQFPDVTLVSVTEPIQYLIDGLKEYKRQLILIETFNKIKDLGSGDINDAWAYLESQCERAAQLDSTKPMDIVHDSKQRADQVVAFNKQARIPTGFAEIDKLMYGGLSTVEELLLLVARTNTGKSWICTKMMESAQKHGFAVLYYSPEMQASFLGTRFDTWRTHTPNSQIFRGNYTEEYVEYLDKLSQEETSAFILEDKDVEGGAVNVKALDNLVKKYNVKLLIIDGLSYMDDPQKAPTDYLKYKNICNGLFKLSKTRGCAVVVAMQANRETQNCKDDKGEPFPGLMQVEGSDHPARIATQAFAIRQIFDKHVLDIRLEKSRNANNQKPVLSYAWDINTGNMQYLPNGDDGSITPANSTPGSVVPVVSGVTTNIKSSDDFSALIDMDDSDDDVEF